MNAGLVLAICLAAGCGSSNDGTPTDGDGAADGGAADASVPADQAVVADQQPAADGSAGPSWEVSVTVSADGTTKEVELGALDTTELDGQPAIRLTRVVEIAALAKPWAYTYNFVASDGYSVAGDKFEGDRGQVPYYGELDLGYLHWQEGDLRVAWDEAAGFPGALNVKKMAGGTIEAVPIGASEILVHVGETRGLVDLAKLPTTDVVNYQHPEDGPVPMVPLTEIFAAAGVSAPDKLKYKIFGDDGFSNNDDNLMPYDNAAHGFVKPADKRIILEEAWDTAECCWSIKQVVVIEGIE